MDLDKNFDIDEVLKVLLPVATKHPQAYKMVMAIKYGKKPEEAFTRLVLDLIEQNQEHKEVLTKHMLRCGNTL